jgi:hypothetical protein
LDDDACLDQAFQIGSPRAPFFPKCTPYPSEADVDEPDIARLIGTHLGQLGEIDDGVT